VPTWSAKAAETHAVSERRPPQKSQGAYPPPRRAARVLPRHRLGLPTVCLGRSGQGSRNPLETRQVAPLRGIPAPGYATETRATLEAPEGCPRVAAFREIERQGRGGTGASDPKKAGPRFSPRPRKTPTQSFAYSVPGRNFGRLEGAAYLRRYQTYNRRPSYLPSTTAKKLGIQMLLSFLSEKLYPRADGTEITFPTYGVRLAA
jgi:hypothetical protein